MKNYFIFSVRTVIAAMITVLYGNMFFAQNITLDGKTDDWAAALNGNPIKVYVRDANATNDDQFTNGASDPNLVSSWGWSLGNTNSKGDISNAAAVLIGSRIYFAADRTAINGDAAIAFWFFTNGTKKNPNGTFSPQHGIGDILVISNFTNGGGSIQLKVYKWVGSGGSNGSLNLIGTTGNAFVNKSYQPTPNYPGWTYQGKNVPSVGIPPPNTYATGSFFEGFVDISPGSGISPCFSSFLLETRNSQSLNASLQDFVSGAFNIKPLAPEVTPGKNCGPGSVTVSASCTTGTQVRWYAQTDSVTPLTSGGNISISGNSLTANITATATFYAACYNAATGCESDRVPVTATINTPPTAEVSQSAIKCNGGNSDVKVTPSGGTSPYTYLWNNGATTASVSLGAGSYSVTVTDANGCKVTKNVEISQPLALTAEVSQSAIKCNGGNSDVKVTPSGGTSPYTYLWNNGATTASVSLGAGSYSVTVTDANGCKVTKNVEISQPLALTAEVSQSAIKCNGGNSDVKVTPSGGTSPYTYLWNNGATTASVSLGAGSYSVTVTDANGCKVTKNVEISQPDPLKVQLSVPALVCSTGTVQVTASPSGGTAPYSYLWSNGSTLETASLGVGVYSVTVKDANGCKATAGGEIKTPACGGFTTVTQGGWGAKAAGNNWGKYRDNNFAGAFPGGLTIGAGSRFLKLTSAKAVEDFLPSGTTARALNPGTMTNPGGSYSNVLAGQTVALTLNVKFDLYDPNFSSSTTHLGDLVVVSGIFANWTVNQILAEANKILGGEPSPYKASQINAIVDAINNNYDKCNNGVLTCPCPDTQPVKGIDSGAVTETKAAVPEILNPIVLYPNPSNGEFTIKFDASAGTDVLVQLYDMAGKLVGDYSSKVVRTGTKATLNVNNNSLAGGIYLVKVKTSQQEKTIKLIIKK